MKYLGFWAFFSSNDFESQFLISFLKSLFSVENSEKDWYSESADSERVFIRSLKVSSVSSFFSEKGSSKKHSKAFCVRCSESLVFQFVFSSRKL